MNADIKQQWLAALRSGDYQQGRRSLRAADTFCCMGVLCDLHQRAGLGRWAGDDYYAIGAEYPSQMALPHAVAVWSGTHSSDPLVADCTLSALNDGRAGLRPHTFAEIADLIDAHL